MEHVATEETGVSDLSEVLKQALEENFELFKEIDKCIFEGDSPESLYSTLAPAGYATLIGRIPGKGRVMLSIKSQSEAPVLINTRTGEKEEVLWKQIFDNLDYLIKYPKDTPDPEGDYVATFGHEPKKEDKKPSAVTVSKEAKPKEDKKPKKADKKPEKTEEKNKKAEEPPKETEETTTAAGTDFMNEPEQAAGVTDLTKVPEIAPAQSEEIKILDKRELERIANGLRSLGDQFDAGTEEDLYSAPIEELEGMIDEIKALPGELIPIIEDAIRRKKQ